MPISMQGAWFVRVKSKSASFDQRFIISGANTGNGTYTGTTSTPEVFVEGNSWNIGIQNDPGSGFLNSTMKLQYPQAISGEYRFDLQSNDSGGDEDFNDLVLTLRTPITDQDYIVYGNISYYKGCLINPCYRIIVIDTRSKLREVLKNSAVYKAVQHYYPSLVDTVGFNPQTNPPTDHFKPIVVPFGGPAIPEKQEVRTVSEPSEISIKADKKEERKPVNYSYNALKSVQPRELAGGASIAATSAVNANRFIEAAKIVDRYRFIAKRDPSHMPC